MTRPTLSPTARGYGPQHRALRRQWQPKVQAGRVHCWRCGQPIPPGSRWELGHDDHDRTITRGPEHFTCNRRAAAAKTNLIRRTKTAQRRTSRRW